MRWPWVSRELFETTSRMLDRAQDTITSLRSELREATAAALRMKREGFEPQPPLPEPPKDLLTTEIRQAIAQRSEPRSRERQHLESVAIGLLEAGVGETEVAHQILEGEDA